MNGDSKGCWMAVILMALLGLLMVAGGTAGLVAAGGM